MNTNFWHTTNSEYEYEDEDKERNYGYCFNQGRWTSDDVVYLVRLFRKHPCLWKHDTASYLNDAKRRRAYESIYKKLRTVGLGVSVIDVIMKIHNLRTAYVEELKKMYEAPLVGAIYKSPHIWFYELDCFLLHYLHVDELETITMATQKMREQESAARVPSVNLNSLEYHVEGEPRTLTQGESYDDGAGCDGAAGSSLGVTPSRHSWGPRPTSPEQNWQQPGRVTEKRATGGGSNSRCYTRSPGSRFCNDLDLYAARSSCRPMFHDEAALAKRRSFDQLSFKMSNESISNGCLTIRRSSDPYDLFAKSLACRLKKLRPEIASQVQLEIQKLLAAFERNQKINVDHSQYSNRPNVVDSASDFQEEDGEEPKLEVLFESKRKCDSR